MKKKATKIDRKAAAALRSGYWRREDAEAVLNILAASGLPLAEFARRHDIGEDRLRRWQRRVDETAEAVPKFHRVRVSVAGEQGRSGADTEGDVGVELVLRGGRRVAVRSGFDATALEELVRTVESW